MALSHRDTAEDVHRNPVADLPTTSPARAYMSGAGAFVRDRSLIPQSWLARSTGRGRFGEGACAAFGEPVLLPAYCGQHARALRLTSRSPVSSSPTTDAKP